MTDSKFTAYNVLTESIIKDIKGNFTDDVITDITLSLGELRTYFRAFKIKYHQFAAGLIHDAFMFNTNNTLKESKVKEALMSGLQTMLQDEISSEDLRNIKIKLIKAGLSVSQPENEDDRES